ncbi:MAG: hypothetical protein ACO1PZ_02530 [Gammaproteobacteria bacterium]
MRAKYIPSIVSGNGVPSFFWLLLLLGVCSSAFARPPRLSPQGAPPAAWLLAGSLVLMCVALTLLSLRCEQERADA